jgi:hypothetical protein
MPKIETPDFKGQIVGCLKQESDNQPSSSEATVAAVMANMAAAIAGGRGMEGLDLKDGHLRELLMMASNKQLSEEAASKALLQLSAQRPDLKNLLTSGPVSHLLQHHLLQKQQRAGEPQALGPMPSGIQPGGSVMYSPGEGDVAMHLAHDGSIKPKKIRHKKRVNGQKICLVCGDRALAHNFDVITCESCKAFFRRNALKGQVGVSILAFYLLVTVLFAGGVFKKHLMNVGGSVVGSYIICACRSV